MNNLLNYQLPVANWVENITEWFTTTFLAYFHFTNDWTGSDVGDYKFTVSDSSSFVYLVIDGSSFLFLRNVQDLRCSH